MQYDRRYGYECVLVRTGSCSFLLAGVVRTSGLEALFPVNAASVMYENPKE